MYRGMEKTLSIMKNAVFTTSYCLCKIFGAPLKLFMKSQEASVLNFDHKGIYSSSSPLTVLIGLSLYQNQEMFSQEVIGFYKKDLDFFFKGDIG